MILSCTLLIYCNTNQPTSNKEYTYDNWHPSTQYVGMETCASCHQEIYETFIKTGMGESWHFATKQKSAATFDQHTIVYDSLNNFYYQPYWRNDSLIIKEFRIANNDTVHLKEEHVKYIVGSGQHTNSHIYDNNGYLSQAPITFYTQKGMWGLAPGFDSKLANRLNRIVGKECITCHNSLPKFVKGSENKYLDVPLGISCERCHGPGEAHVKKKLAGEKVDTSKYIDYSIVNPGRLSKDLQMSVCQRCHAQGVSVLKEGKDYEDFQPGKHLSEVMEVFLPKYDGYQTKFIMASHADRTAMSACYQKSDMTCISCHNPHVSVKFTPREKFNSACINCHKATDQNQLLCSLPEPKRMEKSNDCSGCHMPVSESIDIPNVTIHDHYIRKPIPESAKKEIENFIGLKNITNPTSKDPLTLGKAYLKYFEGFQSENKMLDSAAFHLSKVINFFDKAEPLIHLHYLQNDFEEVINVSKKININKIKEAWNLYRIGEAFYQKNEVENAEIYFKKALSLKPLNLDFKNKLASVYMKKNQIEAAGKLFEEIIQEDNHHIAALNNLGFVSLNLGDISKAEKLYNQALAINPDYLPALLNKVGLTLINKQNFEAKKLLRRILKIDPENEKALILQQQLF